MKLEEFNYPYTGTLTPELIQEARLRGFYENREEVIPYLLLFDQVYHFGGVLEFKQPPNEKLKAKAWGYCQKILQKKNITYQERAVAAMLFSELLEPKLGLNEEH